MNIGTKAETIGALVSAIATLAAEAERLAQDAVDCIDAQDPDQARVNGAIGCLVALKEKAEGIAALVDGSLAVHRL